MSAYEQIDFQMRKNKLGQFHALFQVTGAPAVHSKESAADHRVTAVHHGMNTSSGLRWNTASDRRDSGEHGKHKHSKKTEKKKKSHHSRTKDPADSGSPVIVGGILAGILVSLFIVTGLARLW